MTSIPKTIHYCWFGGAPLGQLEQACIASWKALMPDCNIMRWDESNYDVEARIYTSQAYHAGKWAFVSDCARMDILYRYGGLYLDTDVELLCSLNDLLDRGPFMGFEQVLSSHSAGATTVTAMVAPGLGIAAPAGHWLIGSILETYNDESFLENDGAPRTIPIGVRTTEILRTLGLRDENTLQTIGDLTVYPSDFLCPKSYDTGTVKVTSNTHAIHHYAQSWHSEREQFEYRIRQSLLRRGWSAPAASWVSTLTEVVRFGDVKRVIRALRHPYIG